MANARIAKSRVRWPVPILDFSLGPTWASKNLGVFLCMNCAGVHRSMGTHISSARLLASLTAYTGKSAASPWMLGRPPACRCVVRVPLVMCAQFMGTIGNGKANSFYECRLPPEKSINPSVGETYVLR